MTGGWTTGLLRCWADPALCAAGTLAPCYLGAYNMARISPEQTCGCGNMCLDVACLGSVITLLAPLGLIPCFTGRICEALSETRKSLRNKYNLPPLPCDDCCVTLWCFPCAECQHARELKARGAVGHGAYDDYCAAKHAKWAQESAAAAAARAALPGASCW
jgi:Cys-rich protein (TIGR01571 family)